MALPPLPGQGQAQGLFDGPLQVFGAGVLADDDWRPVVAIPAVLQAERLEALLLHLYGPQLMPAQRAVLVSQWAKYVFMQVIPPVLVAALAHGWHWPLRLEQMALVLDERGIAVAVRFLATGARHPHDATDPLQCFAPLFDDLLGPLIARLSRYGDLPRAVLWSSAGDVLEACLQGLDPSLARNGWPLLNQPLRPCGRRNPLYQTITYTPQRRRRACCLSHRVDWVGRCEHCPLPA